MPLTNFSAMASNNILWVENELHARNYPVTYGQSVIFLDKNENKAYIKSVDQSGVMTGFRRFDLTEIVEPVPADLVPKADFEALQLEVNALKQALENQKKNHNNRRNYNNGQ